MSPNVMCSISLESYHPYLQSQKVSKYPKLITFTVACPKSLNSIYGTHMPLGVNPSSACVESNNQEKVVCQYKPMVVFINGHGGKYIVFNRHERQTDVSYLTNLVNIFFEDI
jgi:hypothetical protein